MERPTKSNIIHAIRMFIYHAYIYTDIHLLPYKLELGRFVLQHRIVTFLQPTSTAISLIAMIDKLLLRFVYCIILCY